VGLANPTKANGMGSVEETDGGPITRQHLARAVRPMDYNKGTPATRMVFGWLGDILFLRHRDEWK
jgi:hypothetical protein